MERLCDQLHSAARKSSLTRTFMRPENLLPKARACDVPRDQSLSPDDVIGLRTPHKNASHSAIADRQGWASALGHLVASIGPRGQNAAGTT